jgi:hypothetical protein
MVYELLHGIQVDQPHLGLPSRDYYVRNRSMDLEAYHAYMTQVRPTMPI